MHNYRSEDFHDFLRVALQKDPRKRPPATKLLKVTLSHMISCDLIMCVTINSTSLLIETC